MILSGYRAMWVFVMFDLPVETPQKRKVATKFRKNLIEDGFWMLQYSVYARPCPSEENAEVHAQRIRSMVPDEGHVRLLRLTDKQFGRMEVFIGKTARPPEEMPSQLEIF